MTGALLATTAAWLASLVGVFAQTAGGWDTALKALNLGLAGVFLYLLVTGVLRRAGEVEEANGRATAAEQRAERAEDQLRKLQESVMSDLSPALLRNSMQGERLVEAATKIAEWVEKLINAFLARIDRMES